LPAADVFRLPAPLKSLELVMVGDPGNAADTNGLGAVAYPFKIGKYEVTTAQYVEFLNAKAKADPDGNLWNNDMDKSRSGEGARCEIRRSGEKGNYRHTVAPEFANRPVTHVSLLDACRFCNWLHNGQGDGDTETGAYTLNGYTGTDGRRIRRNPDAKYFVPTDDEWYKAAYYDPQKPGGPGYWKYPTRSDTKPGRERASTNAANWMDGEPLDPTHYFLEVGSFPKSLSACGTLDQAGNVAEWTEGLKPPFLRSVWGGSFDTDDAGRNIPLANLAYSSASDVGEIGFRIAAAVPGSPITVSKAPALEQQSAVVDFPRRPWLDPLTKKPFFPLAWFSYASDEKDLDELVRQGANLVLFVNGPSDTKTDEQTEENIRRMRAYLDQAQRRNIRVLVQNSGPWKAHMKNDADMLERQRRWVGAIHDRPALFGYQLYDEPEYGAGFSLGVPGQKHLKHFAGSLQAARQSMRTWDPNPDRMISVVFNLVPLSSWTEFLPALDSFQVDRYPLDKDQAYFGHRGDWGPLIMAWSMAHGVEALRDHPQLRNPSPCMQGVGPYCLDGGQKPVWRNPLYDETHYMAYSSLTVGAWGVFHWIRTMGFPESPAISENVKRLHEELHTLIPAFERSYEKPPFTVRHNHDTITRDFLTDSVADITTLALEDKTNYYLIVSNNSGTFSDVTLRLKGLKLATTNSRTVEALNESWSTTLAYSEETGEWMIEPHPMCFGDINVWVIPKAGPAE
jgi:formylglycine-generating enzyme required for sulfatase activity